MLQVVLQLLLLFFAYPHDDTQTCILHSPFLETSCSHTGVAVTNDARSAELEWSLNAGQISYLYHCICLSIHENLLFLSWRLIYKFIFYKGKGSDRGRNDIVTTRYSS